NGWIEKVISISLEEAYFNFELSREDHDFDGFVHSFSPAHIR
ncbi:25338_t:CDS:1, partial [Gigaspora margarita]